MWTLLLLTALAAVPDTPPAPLELTADELATLAKGDVAVRYVEADSGGGVVGFIDLPASKDAVWAAIFDMEARVGEISGLKSVEVYERSPERLGVKWVISVIGSQVVFHLLYDLDPANGWCRYRLDTSKENDVVDVQGAYQLLPDGDRTRLVYRSETDSGRRVPGFVKRWLASDSLTQQLEGIKARAGAR